LLTEFAFFVNFLGQLFSVGRLYKPATREVRQCSGEGRPLAVSDLLPSRSLESCHCLELLFTSSWLSGRSGGRSVLRGVRILALRIMSRAIVNGEGYLLFSQIGTMGEHRELPSRFWDRAPAKMNLVYYECNEAYILWKYNPIIQYFHVSSFWY